MTYYEVGNLILLGLNLIVLVCTLLVLRNYARDTKWLAEAAVEQVPRPCVIVFQLPDKSDEAIIVGLPLSISAIPTIQFKNNGTGHAVNFRYRLGNVGSLIPKHNDTPEVQALASGEIVDSQIPRNALSDTVDFVAEYESLGGAKYRSSAVIEGRKWVKNFRFEKLPPAKK